MVYFLHTCRARSIYLCKESSYYINPHKTKLVFKKPWLNCTADIQISLCKLGNLRVPTGMEIAPEFTFGCDPEYCTNRLAV